MTPDDPFHARVAASFARQTIMQTLGATLLAVRPGEVEIGLARGDHILQQHGFLHAGAVATIADSAAGFAALTTMAEGAGVLTVEFKINLMAPAAGDRFRAHGRVVKAGRTLVIAQADIFARDGNRERHIALLTATMMAMQDRAGISG
jgi:uncharacterized protein (TIGR00369 family)